MAQIRLATLNIAAASKDRARRLLDDWIIPSSHDVYIFTETTDGEGTRLILDAFRVAGWAVFQYSTSQVDRGVAIASRIKATDSTHLLTRGPSPDRCLLVTTNTTPVLEIVGMYVPNRGNDSAKLERKEKFLSYWLDHFMRTSQSAKGRVLIGDLNIVPPSQRPFFLPQLSFEYEWYEAVTKSGNLVDVATVEGRGHEHTWRAHNGEGYTYDHALVHSAIVNKVVSFAYDHTTRSKASLSDHSALVLTIEIESVQRIHENPLIEPKQIELF